MGKHNLLYHIWNLDVHQIRWIMSNSEKLLKTLSSLIENGILSSKDIKKEISTDLKFTRDKLINTLQLVPKEEFEVLKKLVQKQEIIIKRLLKKTKRVKKS